MGKTIFALAGFILAIAVFIFVTKPLYATVGDTQAQVAQYQEALDKAAQLETLKQKLLARYNSFNPSDISRLQVMLPDHVDNIGLILDLDNLASHYGLALENVDISTADNGAGSGAPSAIGAALPASQKYGSLTLHFGTYGAYDNFRLFLTDLEQSLRLVDLESMTLAAGAAQGAGASAAYHYDLTIRTYWLK